MALDLVFHDKASLILRELLAQPGREWVVRDFVSELGVARGWAARVLAVLRAEGLLKGVARGRNAGSVLRDSKRLLREWTADYRFDRNKSAWFYSDQPNALARLKNFFKSRRMDSAYGLTLHTGANLLTHYVRDSNIYAYLDPSRYDSLVSDLRLSLDLKELKQGGNVCFIRPYYKESFLHRARMIQGVSVVSDLQLYLDLFHFPGRGREHAEHLERTLNTRGAPLA
jgi:hypothetical protein